MLWSIIGYKNVYTFSSTSPRSNIYWNLLRKQDFFQYWYGHSTWIYGCSTRWYYIYVGVTLCLIKKGKLIDCRPWNLRMCIISVSDKSIKVKITRPLDIHVKGVYFEHSIISKFECSNHTRHEIKYAIQINTPAGSSHMFQESL